jgi:Kef-type K+ transport system membrane component KefB
MKKILTFSLLLIIGLAASQTLPLILGHVYPAVSKVVSILTMIALGFIMIHVGYEFEIDRSRLRSYGWDYMVAMTAAGFPWIFATLYLLLTMMPQGSLSSWDAWKEMLLAGRFAAPTSAGVLFSMLAAAGLGATWMYRKARVLAIFDDLDTVLLMIPLKMFMVGLAWQLGVIVLVMGVFLWIAWRWMHLVRIPTQWPWVLLYAVVIVAASEALYGVSRSIDDQIPIHIEVLLPAFVLGCIMRPPEGSDPHRNDALEGHLDGPESPSEQRVSTIVTAVFMVLVGMSMPRIGGIAADAARTISESVASPGWAMIAFHVLMLTVIANIGKMYPAFCYRREASRRERLALAVGMWPRGEVGAGVLVVSLGYGIGGPAITVAILSLALNLVLTGVFIWIVKRLLVSDPSPRDAVTAQRA